MPPDLVKRITGWDDLVGLEACKKQGKDFVDGLTALNRLELRSMAVDEANDVSFMEYYHEFEHRKWGHLRQTQVHVQRWKNGKVYEESIYVMPLAQEASV